MKVKELNDKEVSVENFLVILWKFFFGFKKNKQILLMTLNNFSIILF